MWGVLAIAAVSAIMQHYQQEKAAGATQDRLNEIKAMFDSIVPPDLDINVYDDPKIAQTIPAPALNVEKITPELYKSVGQYIPAVADFVKEANPQLVQATDTAKTGRAAQLDALERYKSIASGEFDPQLQQAMSEASRKGNQDAQSRTDSILQDANRRGQLGSGIMLASQQEAASQAMDRASHDSQTAAAEGYRNRLSAVDKSANLGGDIRNSEMSEQARNVGILNDFNQRTSKNYQDYLTGRADAENKARITNLNAQQQISDQNVGLQNKASQDQVERYNQGQTQQYNVARDNQKQAMTVAQQKNALKQQMYQNLMDKARGKAGVATQGIDYINQNARDANATTQGIGNAATSAMVYDSYQKNKKPAAQTASNGLYSDAQDDPYATYVS